MAEATSLIDAIRIGIDMERGAIRAYKRAVAQAATEQCRELFRTLVEWENEHLHYFTSLAEALEGGRSAMTYQRLRGREPSHLGAVHVQELPEQALGDEAEAVRAAITAEREAQEFYTRAADETADATGRSALLMLADEERSHERWLREHFEHLAEAMDLEEGNE